MKETIKQILISVLVFLIIIVSAILILEQMGTIFEDLPPPNSTQEWKMILESSECHWYELGCQKLACVIDCSEINEYAGEIICVC